MEWIQNINLQSLLNSLVSLITAFICGGLIGFERQYRQRTAGLRTNVLVAVGAAIFVDMADRLDGHGGAARVVSYVVSGIGFLGAGVIMRDQGNVRGLNTAATLWGSAAVGACAGADLVLEAALGTAFVIMANTLLRPVVNLLSRRPIDTATLEVTNTVYVLANRSNQKDASAFVKEFLESANYPIRDMQIHAFGADQIEIEASLMATSVQEDELDNLVKHLVSNPIIDQAFWSPSMQE